MITSPQLFSSPSVSTTKHWRLKHLLYAHLLIALLIFSLFFPPTHALWRGLDTALFNLINPSLEGPAWWQSFWACANHKWADWFEDLCILGFFVAFVTSGSRFVRPRRVAQLIICTAYSAAIIYFFNRLIVRDHIHFYWPSPSAVFDHAVHLSDKITWIHIKDSSLKSFPGDHATTAFFFAAFYGYLARGRLALCAGIYAALLALPRLITGAHWLSDILVGTTSVVIFFLSWLFFTPLFHTLTNRLEAFFIRILTFKRKWQHLIKWR